jgi:exodeoxyribonuclease V alpha subunit
MVTASHKEIESVSGIVQHLTYVNGETGYFVARVNVQGRGERTVTGSTPVIRVGEEIKASGTWTSSQWGPQFKATEVHLSVPTMCEGIEKYLANSVDGIGKGFAKKLVAEFGEQVFDVIENEPERLARVKGIGPKRAASVIEAYTAGRAIREIMVFLHKAGLSTARAVRVHKLYGDSAIAKIKENPYILCRDVWGIGFGTADEVAQKQGISPQSEYRARAGIQHIVNEAVGQGSCGLPVVTVLERASELLGVDYDLLERCIELELSCTPAGLMKDKASGQDCLFKPTVYVAEQSLARAILDLTRRVPARPIHDLDMRILEAEVELGLELGESQREAARVVLSSTVSVLTGGPGTGKTTITKLILKVLEDSADPLVGGNGSIPCITLAAPTGKAAKRASEATGRPASTVHRVLEMDRSGQFKHNQHNRLEGDVFVADEFSMSDVFLSDAYVKALPSHGRLIIVGDVDQLESVGPGKVLSDIIESGVVPVVRLREVYRQAAKSDIIKNAHAINRGEMPRLGYFEGSDFCFNVIEAKDRKDDLQKREARAKIASEIVRLCRDMYRLGYDPIKDVQVLSPMRKGNLGVEALNVALQAALNPHPAVTMEAWGSRWCTGDKAMQLKNNYDKDIFNGDVGFIVDINTHAKLITVEYGDKLVEYRASELDELTLAYAMTIHRSQGSEFPVVVMPVDYAHFTMLKRNLFYTGVTRARKLFVGLGSRDAVKKSVETVQSDDRFTRLKEWLRGLGKTII